MRESNESKMVFKQITESEFIRLMDQSVAPTNIECTKDLFRLKKAYPVSDKSSLKEFLI